MAEGNAPGQEEHIRSGGDTGAVDNNAGFAALEPIEPFFVGDGQNAPVGFLSWEPLAFEAPSALLEGDRADLPTFGTPEPPVEPALDWGNPAIEAPVRDTPTEEISALKLSPNTPSEQELARQDTGSKNSTRRSGNPLPKHQAEGAAQSNTRQPDTEHQTGSTRPEPPEQAFEEFPDWHPATHGFQEESIVRNDGEDYLGYIQASTQPPRGAPAANRSREIQRQDRESAHRSLRVDPSLPTVSIDEAPVRAFIPGGAEPRPMAAGRMSRAGAASIGSGLTAEEKDNIERQAQRQDRHKKRPTRKTKQNDYKRGFRRMSEAQREKAQKRSPYAPAFGAQRAGENPGGTEGSSGTENRDSTLFREGSALNEALTPTEKAFLRSIAEEEARGVGTGRRSAAGGTRRLRVQNNQPLHRSNAAGETNLLSWKQKVRAARAAEEADPYTRAKTIVYNQLAYSAKTRGQLRKKLQAEGFDTDLIEPLLDKFEAAKLINDAEYAETFVRQKSRTKKLSRAALRRELAERGVRGEEAENALAQRTDEQEREDAAALVRKKLRPGTDLSDRAERDKLTRRLLGMLGRRGYSSSVSMAVIREELATLDAGGETDEGW